MQARTSTISNSRPALRDGDSRSSLHRLMAPESVAVVGASPAGRHGRPMIENFGTLGFAGDVYAVNPRYEEVLGIKCYRSLRDLPRTPDAVMIGVNKERVVPVLRDAAEMGVGGVVLTAIGYAESGETGRRDQAQLATLIQEAGMALVGPNCMGLINFSAASALYLDPVSSYQAGSVSLLSHSGSVAVALTNNSRGVRWSHVVSSGNEAVTGSADLLGYAVDDPHTTIITAFLETIREPQRFFAECERAYEAGKPVVVLKSGRSEQARAAAQAHSGALALPDRLINELFARHHVIRVQSMEDLLTTVTLLGTGRRPRGKGVAIVSESGGEVEIIHDEVDQLDLRLPAFEPRTLDRISDYLPPGMVAGNPLDLWALVDPHNSYPKLLADLLTDPEVSTLLAVVQTDFDPARPGDATGQKAQAVISAAAGTEKPVALVAPLGGSPGAELVEDMALCGVATLSGFGDALRAVAHVARYSAPPVAPATEIPLADTEIVHLFKALGGAPSGGQLALELLAAAGIPTVTSIQASDEDEAVRAADRIGYPVVVKTGDPSVLHKTESGRVVLNLEDESAVRAAVGRVRGSGSFTTSSVIVQDQVSDGLELIVGIQTAGDLGSFILVGSGGIWAEVLQDSSIRPAQLRQDEPRQMLAELRASRLLHGLRGKPPLDVEAVIEAVARIDALARLLGPQLTSLEINPLVVRPSGVIALDALIVPKTKEPQ